MEYGKLSPAALQRLIFTRLGTPRTEVVNGAAVGEDSAILDLGGDWVVASCDPITGTTTDLGGLAVHVSCNDIAANGASPVGVLLTLLLPLGTPETSIAEIMDGASEACRRLGIEIVGGHTELTPAVVQPVAVATALGRARPGSPIRSAGALPGFQVIMTKGAGLEGTSILAHDFADELGQSLGVELVSQAQALRDQISVVREAAIAAAHGAVAMHDVTEGGLLGAVYELATASGTGITLWREKILIRPETAAICCYFEIDPLRLISSGTLLIVAPDGLRVIEALRRAEIPCAIIGEVTRGETVLVEQGESHPLAAPESDELWRFLASRRPAGG
ncbi:MAG: AIR synthase family protein [Bacillota bacterium]